MKTHHPALPARLIDPRPVIAAGTAAWLVSLATLLVVGVHTTAMWVAVCGIAVGIVIYAIFWQRSAVRRGLPLRSSLPDVQRKGDEGCRPCGRQNSAPTVTVGCAFPGVSSAEVAVSTGLVTSSNSRRRKYMSAGRAAEWSSLMLNQLHTHNGHGQRVHLPRGD
ncbi:MAG: DUF2530 domain-containing protein [Lawsonella clevelandensis]